MQSNIVSSNEELNKAKQKQWIPYVIKIIIF